MELDRHILSTYMKLRLWVGVIGIIFPFLLWVGGVIQGVPLQGSMSDYFHANQTVGEYDTTPDDGVMRSWFVGILFVVGVTLILYKGFSNRENWLLNIAGVLAVCVAIFPKEWNCDECAKITIHGVCAISFFICIAIVCIWCASNTLHLLNESDRVKYRRAYWLLGAGMIASPLAAWLLTRDQKLSGSYIFFVEALGVCVFAIYWIVKSIEIYRSNADQDALTKKIGPMNLINQNS